MEPQKIMSERFGHDRLISLATSENNVPYVRAVNSVYQDGCFYMITHDQSSKMKQIEHNPQVAICGEWFNGHGFAENLGHVLKEENLPIYRKLKTSFENWIQEGHIDETDKKIVLLCVHLKTGVLYADGIRYELHF